MSRIDFPSKFSQAITITFGDVAENHIGNQQIGTRSVNGFSILNLKTIQTKVPNSELINLNAYTTLQTDEAAILVIRDGVNFFLQGIGKTADDMYNEQNKLETDKKYYDTRRKSVLNKNARHNLCFSDQSQSANYESGLGTVIAFNQVPCTNEIRRKIGEICDKVNLPAEGNYYYNPNKTGIGFHGDAERRIVIAVRLGVSIPLHYQWFHKSEPIGNRCILKLNHGDMYIMSEKAVGYDWKRKVIPTLRHAAGCEEYTKIKPKKSKIEPVVIGLNPTMNSNTITNNPNTFSNLFPNTVSFQNLFPNTVSFSDSLSVNNPKPKAVLDIIN